LALNEARDLVVEVEFGIQLMDGLGVDHHEAADLIHYFKHSPNNKMKEAILQRVASVNAQRTEERNHAIIDEMEAESEADHPQLRKMLPISDNFVDLSVDPLPPIDFNDPKYDEEQREGLELPPANNTEIKALEKIVKDLDDQYAQVQKILESSVVSPEEQKQLNEAINESERVLNMHLDGHLDMDVPEDESEEPFDPTSLTEEDLASIAQFQAEEELEARRLKADALRQKWRDEHPQPDAGAGLQQQQEDEDPGGFDPPPPQPPPPPPPGAGAALPNAADMDADAFGVGEDEAVLNEDAEKPYRLPRRLFDRNIQPKSITFNFSTPAKKKDDMAPAGPVAQRWRGGVRLADGPPNSN